MGRPAIAENNLELPFSSALKESVLEVFPVQFLPGTLLKFLDVHDALTLPQVQNDDSPFSWEYFTPRDLPLGGH